MAEGVDRAGREPLAVEERDEQPRSRVADASSKGFARGVLGFARGGTGGERFDLDVWRARVTDRLLIAVAAMGAVVVASSVLQAVNEPAPEASLGVWLQTVPFVAAYLFVLALAVLRGRLSYRVRAWGLLLVGYLVGCMYLAILGLLGNGVVFLLALPALGLIILGIRSGILMAALSALIYLLFTAAAGAGLMADWLIITENTLAVGQWVSQGLSFGLILVALVVMLAMLTQAQEQALAETREAADDLAKAHAGLASSSSELDRYTQLLEVAAGISHEISGVLARDELLVRAVDLMSTRLALRGVAVYLIDPASGELVAGPSVGQGWLQSPEAGDAEGERVPPVVSELLRARGYSAREYSRRRVPGPGDSSGAVQEGAEGVGATAEMMSGGEEVALPLHVGRAFLGVLYVVSPEEGPLTEREVQSLHVMADQLAVALDNARLFGEVQTRLDELNALQRQYTTDAWGAFVADRPRPEYLWQPTSKPGDAGREHPEGTRGSTREVLGSVWQETLARVREGGDSPGKGTTGTGPVTGYDQHTNQHVVAVPVRLRETVIGVLAFHRPRDAGPWQREEIAAIEAVGARLAFATENLRLLEQTQRRAARERLVDQITRRMQTSLDPETILKVAVREVGRALGASQTLVEIGLGEPEAGPVRVPEASPGLSGGNGGTAEG